MRNYGKKKVPEKEKPTKYKGCLFSIHNIYTPEVLERRKWVGDHYTFISIDPAIKNFGFAVEKRYKDGTIQVECLYKCQFTEIVEVGNKGERKEVNVDPLTLENITIRECTQFLDEFDSWYDQVNFILVEQQMIENWYSTRIMQHVFTYFTMIFRSGTRGKIPIIIEQNSKLKGDQLGYFWRDGITLKEFAVERAKEFAKTRKDKFVTKVIGAEKKQDDMSDVIIMIEAFCRYMNIEPLTPDKVKYKKQKRIGYGINPASEHTLYNIHLYREPKLKKEKKKPIIIVDDSD